eukprot:COSAG06_NODE_42598_length_380_cov_0.765125_1_plen_23_part_10
MSPQSRGPHLTRYSTQGVLAQIF